MKAGKDTAARATTATGGGSGCDGGGGSRGGSGGGGASSGPPRVSHPSAAAAGASVGPVVVAEGTASVERTFQSLAVMFGETMAPLRRGASRQEREAVWTGRMRHFHARIQEQQVCFPRVCVGRWVVLMNQPNAPVRLLDGKNCWSVPAGMDPGSG